MKEDITTMNTTSHTHEPKNSEGIPTQRDFSSVGDNPAEAVLGCIGYLFLVIGLGVSVVLGLLLIMDNHEWDNKIGWAILLGGSTISIVIWAFFMIWVNISNNIRQIKYEIRELIKD